MNAPTTLTDQAMTDLSHHCPLCGQPAQHYPAAHGDHSYACSNDACGSTEITHFAQEKIPQKTPAARAAIATLAAEVRRRGRMLIIRSLPRRQDGLAGPDFEFDEKPWPY